MELPPHAGEEAPPTYNSLMPATLCSVSAFRWGRRAAPPLLLCLLTALLPGVRGSTEGTSERWIGPGVRLLSRHGGPGPQFVLAVEADLDNPYLRTGISVGRGTALGLEPLSRQVSRLARPDRAVVAAVNGDFFYYPSREQPGIPTGATVLGDEVVRTPFRRSALILPPVGTPRIAILNLTGSVRQQDRLLPLSGVNQPRKSGDLVLYTPWFGSTTRTDATGLEIELEPEAPMLQHGADLQVRVAGPPRAAGNSPISASRWVLSGSGASQNFLRELQAGAILTLRLDFDPPVTAGEQVIAGGPRLMREGRVAVEAEGGSLNGAFVTSRHPRTAVGIAGRRLLLVTVDGRQPGFSAGMSLPELAEEMRRLGCTDALNLDGGGSTTFWVRGLIANQPSDGRERPVANGLVLFSTAPYGGPARLACTPREVHALPGARVPVAVLAEDQHYNLVAPPVPL
ncbi:MAG: phosphodiester glycosidase family protein, partial [Armatimonadetes bacterium]|nr:phosphodiester glycosidase family protein [Armatimonadota bacterium]